MTTDSAALYPQSPRPLDQVHIPRGVADYFWAEGFARRQLELRLLELFRTWGYEDVIPPMFEFADTYTGRASPKLQAELYRFLDRDGSTLALRADMTISVARLVGVRLHDWPMPQRYCYAGSVFRYIEPQAGRQREFWQAGVELIGANSAQADAEVLALAVEAMRTAGIADVRLVLGQLQYFDGLLHALDLTPEQTSALQSAVDRNSEAQLAEFLRTTPLRTQQRRTLEELPALSGANPLAVIDQADRLCLNHTMHQALENLRAILSELAAYNMAEVVYLDLTEINNLGYYTGITFEVLCEQPGFPVGSGGRYDRLVGTFGEAQPAVGVALGIDRMLLARRGQMQDALGDRPVAPDLLVATGGSDACLQIIRAWRAAGLRVAASIDGRQGAALWELARQTGAAYALTWTGDGFDLLDASAAELPPVEVLPAAASPSLLTRCCARVEAAQAAVCAGPQE